MVSSSCPVTRVVADKKTLYARVRKWQAHRKRYNERFFFQGQFTTKAAYKMQW